MPRTTTILEEARQLQDEIVTLRRRLHQMPELSFQEHETSTVVAEKLERLGFSVKTGLAGTGVTGDIGEGVTVAIRADMDALPVQEVNDASYRSKKIGVMHACGHDAHMSCAIGAAKLLSASKPAGRYRILFQPAEEFGDQEGKSGAYRMIEAGAMTDVDAVIGLHVDASLPAGKVGLIPGPITAAADTFKLIVTGKGGHGAYPETTVDSIVIASQIIQAIQQIVSRRISPLDPAVVTVGSIHSESERGNVISPAVTMEGTIRSFTAPVREKLIAELERACSIARVLGGDYQLHWELGYPPTVNDPAITEVMREAACDLIGPDNVINIEPKTWGEDFSMLAQKAPGAFMLLGVEVSGDRRAHHSPNFDIDESGLYIGSAIFAETARRLVDVLSRK
jgi:amidohydrolase